MNLNPARTIKNYFIGRKKKKFEKAKLHREELTKWVGKLFELGFNDITFPIFIITDEYSGIELTCAQDFEEFAFTYSLHYWPKDEDSKLLDSNGNLWSWKYDNLNKTNLPDSILIKLTLENVKELLIEGIAGYKSEIELKDIIKEAGSIKELFNRLAIVFPYFINSKRNSRGIN